MVEGLTIGYATAEVMKVLLVTNDESTLWITYTSGPISVGYQSSSVDGQTATQDDEAIIMGISYSVTDDFQFLMVWQKLSYENTSLVIKSLKVYLLHTQWAVYLFQLL